jgi:hypothetical protein
MSNSDLLLGREPLDTRVPRKRQRVTDDMRALIRKLHAEGCTDREISRRTGIPGVSVFSHRRAMGLPKQDARTDWRDRFWAYVVPEPNSGCWLWDGFALPLGYGRLTVRGRGAPLATHLSLEIAGRPVPRGMCACHRCDNPACVNPDHLFIGTRADNNRDAKQKGRLRPNGLSGSRHYAARLSDAQAAEVRRRAAAGEVQRRIAEAFGVSVNVINRIVLRQSYRNV